MYSKLRREFRIKQEEIKNKLNSPQKADEEYYLPLLDEIRTFLMSKEAKKTIPRTGYGYLNRSFFALKRQFVFPIKDLLHIH